MVTPTRRVQGRPYWRIYSRRKRRAKVCWLCGEIIDNKLDWPDPMSYSIDHVVPLSAGGAELDQANMRDAHLKCNQRRGRARGKAPTNPTSRPW